MPLLATSPRYRFASPEGYELIKKTLRSRLPYVPHDYQLEGVGQLLDGKDLVAVLATGSGKTGYYLIYALMLLELSKNPALCQSRYPAVPKDPCMVIVYPTNGLEEEQATVFEKAGLATLVINATTLENGRKAGTDLWVVARTDITLILLSPELLSSPRFDGLLQNAAFQSRVCALGIDEIHLLYSWGQSFRKSFRQLGFARARFPLGTRLLGTTATLLIGLPQKTILSFVGLREGDFHLLRRSNIRANVQTIFRTLSRGLGGWSFPDLKWVLRDGRKTVIHCRTIAIGFRVAIYLWHRCPPGSDPTKRVRMYNALSWPSYNAETRRLMQNDPGAQIIVATASFMVGIDLPNIADVVILGNVVSADEHVQWEGRPGRDPTHVQDARCITYVTKKTWKIARALVDGNAPKKTSGKKAAPVQLETNMARLMLARCVTAEQNLLYGNPLVDPPCSCPRCSSLPSPLVSDDPNGCGKCSGCQPEEVAVPLQSHRRTAPNPVPRRQRLTRPMRAEGTKQLQDFRTSVYRTSTATSAAARALSPVLFLPDSTIKAILDQFALLDTPATLHKVIAQDLYILPHADALWTKITELRGKFSAMREKQAEKKGREAAKKKAAENGRKGEGTAGGPTGEFSAVQSGSLEECCVSFQVEVTGNALAEMQHSANYDMDPVNVEWNLVDGALSVTDADVSQGGRKRSSTNSTINPRPRNRQCLSSKHNKENVPPHV